MNGIAAKRGRHSLCLVEFIRRHGTVCRHRTTHRHYRRSATRLTAVRHAPRILNLACLHHDQNPAVDLVSVAVHVDCRNAIAAVGGDRAGFRQGRDVPMRGDRQARSTGPNGWLLAWPIAHEPRQYGRSSSRRGSSVSSPACRSAGRTQHRCAEPDHADAFRPRAGTRRRSAAATRRRRRKSIWRQAFPRLAFTQRNGKPYAQNGHAGKCGKHRKDRAIATPGDCIYAFRFP